MQQPYVITISSEKGGVGKTTVAINLAIFIKALAEDLPVTLLSFDNHFSVDRMFRIGNNRTPGHVGDLFAGVSADNLTETGEFGVQFIPSCQSLADWKSRIPSPQTLAEVLASSQLQGVLIIDTRPDMDIFTQNAIACADRVIIPVKDTPSLENCRHLFEFADTQQIPRQRLKVLPCLVDFRIQYDGPFKNPHQLMKAYAINRGYRCFDDCISKSPKVESLNTNPEGKIFPVLTYGKGTDVHQQFTTLAREMLAEIEAPKPRRLTSIAEQLSAASASRQEAYRKRLDQLESRCPLCGETMFASGKILPGAAFYAESSNLEFGAFLHEACVSRMIHTRFFGQPDTGDIPAPVQELLREAYRRCYFVLRRTPGTRGFIVPKISLYRFDEDGLEISHQTCSLGPEGGTTESLSRFVKAALAGDAPADEEAFVVMRRVASDLPESILLPESRRAFEQVCARIGRQFPRS